MVKDLPRVIPADSPPPFCTRYDQRGHLHQARGGTMPLPELGSASGTGIHVARSLRDPVSVSSAWRRFSGSCVVTTGDFAALSSSGRLPAFPRPLYLLERHVSLLGFYFQRYHFITPLYTDLCETDLLFQLSISGKCPVGHKWTPQPDTWLSVHGPQADAHWPSGRGWYGGAVSDPWSPRAPVVPVVIRGLVSQQQRLHLLWSLTINTPGPWKPDGVVGGQVPSGWSQHRSESCKVRAWVRARCGESGALGRCWWGCGGGWFLTKSNMYLPCDSVEHCRHLPSLNVHTKPAQKGSEQLYFQLPKLIAKLVAKNWKQSSVLKRMNRYTVWPNPGAGGGLLVYRTRWTDCRNISANETSRVTYYMVPFGWHSG